jgi:hypothetical protein
MNQIFKDFNKDDRIYKIIYSLDISDNIITTVDTSKIYKIVSVRNDFFGDGLTKYVSIDSAVVLPESETDIKQFGEYYELQTSVDGNVVYYAIKN